MTSASAHSATSADEQMPTSDEAPYEYAVCRSCFYEKRVGDPCGEPCV